MFETYDEIIELSDFAKLSDLIRDGFDVSKPDSVGNFVLNPVCRALKIELADELIQAGADVNALSADGYTPLLSAIDRAHLNPELALKVVSLLLDSGADIEKRGDWDKTPFLKSCTRGVKKISELLVDRGCDVFAQSAELGGPMGAREFADLASNTADFRIYIDHLCSQQGQSRRL